MFRNGYFYGIHTDSIQTGELFLTDFMGSVDFDEQNRSALGIEKDYVWSAQQCPPPLMVVEWLAAVVLKAYITLLVDIHVTLHQNRRRLNIPRLCQPGQSAVIVGGTDSIDGRHAHFF